MERPSRLLVIQPRLDTGVIQREQRNLRNIAGKEGYKPTFANPLEEQDTTPWEKPDDILRQYDAILFGGSSNFDLDEPSPSREKYVNRALPLAQKILAEGEHALGVCLGHQTLAAAAGGDVRRIAEREETGTVDLHLNEHGQKDPILNGLPASFAMIYGHNNSVSELPQGFRLLGRTLQDPNSAMRKDNVVTFQGHPEIDDPEEVKRRVEASKGTPHEYVPTHPFVDPHPEIHQIIVNFLSEVKKSAK